jgi:hypothetical protein
MPTNKVD